jgi:hypothetical protein
MGLAYTIDSPIKVARFGIDSVISIMEDNLVEKMRSHYYEQIGEIYHPIASHESDARARRITDYLNLTNRIVKDQIERLRAQPFEEGSEICRYFQMLPDENDLKKAYKKMLAQTDINEKLKLETWLRCKIRAGSIDVNIMTKVDKNNTNENGDVIEDGSDAVSALRGYVQSDLVDSSVVLSAGMNPRLFSYMEKRPEFAADERGLFKKKIVVKVSDFRSALIQGKMLAKKGLWVSEFRIESGLNCGGHAFASDGFLLGPILEQFKSAREELANELFTIYNQVSSSKNNRVFSAPLSIKVTVQGGIGTAEEDEFLRTYYGVDGTGWGTPFLLVPEATTVDDHTIQLLRNAAEKDVILSGNSPLGVRFHYLKGTTADLEKAARIGKGRPGSPCTEKFLVSNTEFTKEPICTASRKYQKRKIEQLSQMNLAEDELQQQMKVVLDKECLCIGLSNAAVKKMNVKPFIASRAVNICPGPNIAYFGEIVSLQKMVNHIYGRTDIIQAVNRPHMFVKELCLYVGYWRELLADARGIIDSKRTAYIKMFYDNLMSGIHYYRSLTNLISARLGRWEGAIHKGLDDAENELKQTIVKFLPQVLQTV